MGHIFVFMSCKDSISSKFTFNKNCLNFSESKPPKKDWKVILGRSGYNKHPHRLAIEQIKSGKPITVNIINDILAYCDISITKDKLKDLLNSPKFLFSDLNKDETIKPLKNLIGSPSGKIQVPGVYIFKNKGTGDKYVGSSSQLAVRLNGYLKGNYKNVGLLIPLLNKGAENFTLEVIPLYDSLDIRSEIVLEQYYLLNPSFNLNTVKVANNPSGSNAKPLYMYNRDKTILYYHSTQQKDFINNLSIHYATFNKHLKKGTYYLGKYLFTREPVLTAKIKEMPVLNLGLMLEKDRVKYNKNKPLSCLSKSVLLIDASNSNNTYLFFSLNKCIDYLKNKGLSANQTTLVKHINLGKAYHGYMCKYV